MTAQNEKLEAALIYASRGWAVLPLHTPMLDGECSCASPKCVNNGKHPRFDNLVFPEGVKSASVSKQAIERMWYKWPDANVGIATGAKSGIIVLDVDPQHGGDDSLYDLLRQCGQLPQTPESLTGGGGRHIIFAHPGHVVRNSTSKVAPGLDVRGDGGYIVAPPSLHPSGNYYTWDVGNHPADKKPAQIPAWLLRLMQGTPEPSGNGRAKQAAPLPDRIITGARNATLMSLAGSMRRRGADEDAIMAALLVVNERRCNPPLDVDEVQRIAASAAHYEVPETAKGTPTAVATDILHYPQTDTGNAEVLQALYGDRLRYDHRRGRWLVWAGDRWQTDPDGELYRLAVLATRARLRAAANVPDEKERSMAVKWAMSSENRQRLCAGLDMARTLRQIADTGENWDSDPWLMGCANGVIDLRTGTSRKPEPGDRLTLSTPIPFDGAATAPRWLQFLQEVFGGNQDLISFVQRAAGYSLTGDVREQCLFLCYGSGANGKSTLLNTLRLVAGDYAANTPFNTFELSDTRSGQTNDLAALCGRRLVTAAETAEAQRLNEARVKAITGGDPVTARFLHREFFTYQPTYKVWLAVNHKPKVVGTDDGIWRRIRPIPFLVSFRGREDKTLQDDLRAELPGILAWCVRGAGMWQMAGLMEPPTVTEAAETYRNESDVIWQFLQDTCIMHVNASVGASELYQTYRTWCHQNNEHELNSREFSQEMQRRKDIGRTRRGSGVYYTGVGMAATEERGVQSGLTL